MKAKPRVKKLTDPRTMRALAHPLRLRLLGLLRTGGPATVSTLADAVDEVVPAVSYHLRQLAAHGFIEEANELARDRRERWWRASHERTSWSMTEFLDTPERLAAVGALQHEVLRRHVESIERFMEVAPAWSRAWIDASDQSDMQLHLTPEELKTMRSELWEVLERWSERPRSRDGSERVSVIIYAFPREGGTM